VVLPSPAPYLVPIFANKFAYVVREYAPPWHGSKNDGNVSVGQSMTTPISAAVGLAAVGACCVINDLMSAGVKRRINVDVPAVISAPDTAGTIEL
jgi:hypothetical protein